ncbi:hypothetical protein BU16DRAFT_521943, partial [Lophium mytilinum]
MTLPIMNRPATIYGCSISFQITAWLAVALRLYTRYKLPKTLGWDDFFVTAAVITATVGSAIICLQPGAGLGQHMNTLSEKQLSDYFYYVFGANSCYIVSATLIKLSILLQYLRLFEESSNKWARRSCFIMLGVVSCWGIAFFFTQLCGCTPIKANWDLDIKGARCVMFGSKEPKELFAAFAGHAASNMLLDILILLLPVPFLSTIRLEGKRKKGIISLLVIGGIVAIFSAVRLFSIAQHRAGTSPVLDLTYYSPPIFIFSSLEIQVAIICASTPVFWPMLESINLGKIFVTQEVEVVTESREMASSSEERDLGFSRSDSQQSLKGRDSDDRKDYQNDWAVPDFLEPGADRDNDATYGVSARRATTPFDPLKVLD